MRKNFMNKICSLSRVIHVLVVYHVFLLFTQLEAKCFSIGVGCPQSLNFILGG